MNCHIRVNENWTPFLGWHNQFWMVPEIDNPIIFKRLMYEELWYWYCSYSKDNHGYWGKYLGIELLRVVCGQHASQTSAHVTFIYGKVKKNFIDQNLIQLKNWWKRSEGTIFCFSRTLLCECTHFTEVPGIHLV